MTSQPWKWGPGLLVPLVLGTLALHERAPAIEHDVSGRVAASLAREGFDWITVASAGGRIAHVDVTITCESPRIGPHRLPMREKIASLLRLDLTRISVKATTTERLGFTGRGEGIAAQAVATVRLPETL